ncbi:uncharacterized protein F13E9.13, mitochondrial-like [Diadema antillarum]|uniref:uncharacterized protein F13E9.13, mitochondrial-like n=1 Tax=Diadema antillarum TaxID=105358 RepID=UPI003A89AC28
MSWFQRLFGHNRGVVIGMIHIQALPGTPRHSTSIAEIVKKACLEAKGYVEAGINALMLENMHDVPYVQPDQVGPEVTASMTAVSCAVRQMYPDLPIGVQVLSAANQQALAVAQAAGLNFIRAEGFVFSHVGDEGILNACAGELLRYRRQIGADDVKVLTDIKKKHSSHAITSDVSLAETAKAAEFFLSDGVIVTGTSTGCATSLKDVEDVRQAVSIPVLIGSGVSPENLAESLTAANGCIVGSHFKLGGQWQNDVDFARVRQFMEEVRKFQT